MLSDQGSTPGFDALRTGLDPRISSVTAAECHDSRLLVRAVCATMYLFDYIIKNSLRMRWEISLLEGICRVRVIVMWRTGCSTWKLYAL